MDCNNNHNNMDMKNIFYNLDDLLQDYLILENYIYFSFFD